MNASDQIAAINRKADDERYQKSFAKAEEIVKSWPKWKREYKLTKYCVAPMGA